MNQRDKEVVLGWLAVQILKLERSPLYEDESFRTRVEKLKRFHQEERERMEAMS